MGTSRTSDPSLSFPNIFSRHWPARGLDQTVSAIDVSAVGAEYVGLRERAPQRSRSGKKYFVGHSGLPSTHGKSNRREEHYAIALYNLSRALPRSNGRWFRLIDYQIPLKAQQSDAGIGKIDLLGVTDEGQLVIVELKVESEGGGRSDAPPSAMMEGLRYAAMVEADIEAIAIEAQDLFGIDVSRLPPIIQVLAPDTWWQRWLNLTAAGDWGAALAEKSQAIEAATGAPIEFMAFDAGEITYGADGQAPRLEQVPTMHLVSLGNNPAIGDALSVVSIDQSASENYSEEINKTLWTWAERHHASHLDGGKRQHRPPVFAREHVALNVLLPPDGSNAEEILNAIPHNQRHKYFGSTRSSQALAQSVFGAIAATGQLDILRGITSECGRTAFFKDQKDWTIELEHEVNTLGEPRPTSIDAFLCRHDNWVAIECKFTEPDFGTCSRPRLKLGDACYNAQRCNGNYEVQAGRGERCALTSIGIKYWDHLPHLFDWQADRDHSPCPFSDAYQLARNALAAVVSHEGNIDPSQGHALIVYDARNPAFQVGGKANQQWEAIQAACLVPGLLRRISWQRLVKYIAKTPELNWLFESLQEKYGI